MLNLRQMDRSTRFGVGLVLLSTLLFATMSASGRVLRADFRADSLASFRFLLQTLILLPWALTHPPTRRPFGIHLGRSILGAATMLLFYGALKYLPLGLASLLVMSSVLWATAFGHFILKERVTANQALAGAGVMLGMVLCLAPGETAHNWVWDPLGVGLALAAGFTMGAAKAVVKGMRRGTTDPREIVFYFGLFGTLFCTPSALLFPEWPTNATQWGLLFLVGLCGTGGQLLFTTAFRYISILVMSSLGLLGTLVNVSFGLLLLGEVPPLSFLFGAAVVLGGIYVLTRPPRYAQKFDAI